MRNSILGLILFIMLMGIFIIISSNKEESYKIYNCYNKTIWSEECIPLHKFCLNKTNEECIPYVVSLRKKGLLRFEYHDAWSTCAYSNLGLKEFCDEKVNEMQYTSLNMSKAKECLIPLNNFTAVITVESGSQIDTISINGNIVSTNKCPDKNIYSVKTISESEITDEWINKNCKCIKNNLRYSFMYSDCIAHNRKDCIYACSTYKCLNKYLVKKQ